MTSRRELRAYFSGQNIALGAVGVPLLVAISFGLAAAARQPGYGFLGMAVDLAGLGAALALSNIFTVVLPYPVEQRAGSPTPRDTGPARCSASSATWAASGSRPSR